MHGAPLTSSPQPEALLCARRSVESTTPRLAGDYTDESCLGVVDEVGAAARCTALHHADTLGDRKPVDHFGP